MAREQRPFNPDVLQTQAVAEIRARIGAAMLPLRRYTVFVPLAHLQSDGTRRIIATAEDLLSLEETLALHFGGITVPTHMPVVKGVGARDPQHPQETLEVNEHAYYTVYAALHDTSDQYFRALRDELQDALAEGVILIERQDVIMV